MKKVIIAIAIVFAVTTSAFASSKETIESIERSVKEKFSSEFKGASDVQWTVTENAYLAIFTLNGNRMEALFTNSGEYIGTSISITLEDLPLKAKRSFAKKYEGYTVKEAQKYMLVDETAYYILAEKDAKKVIVKLSDHGDLSIAKMIK